MAVRSIKRAVQINNTFKDHNFLFFFIFFLKYILTNVKKKCYTHNPRYDELINNVVLANV